LLEPQRTNLIVNSEYFASWNLSGGSLTANATTSPEGVQNAYLYTEDTSTNYHRLNIGASATNSNKVYSVYAKLADGAVNKWLTIDNGPTAWFDLENGVVGSAAGSVVISIEDAGSGWYRCIYHNPASTTGAIYIGIAASNGGAGNHTGSGLPAFYAYGAQCEDNVTYPTSYIPTYGSSVTRVVDSCLDGGDSNVFDNDTAVWFIDIERIGTDSAVIGDSLSLRDSSNVRQITLWFDAPTKQIRFRDGKNSFTTIGSSGGVISTPDNTRIKIALKIDGTTLKVFADGVQKGSDYTRPTAFDITQMDMEGKGYKIRNIQFLNSTLTDQEMIDLTTL